LFLSADAEGWAALGSDVRNSIAVGMNEMALLPVVIAGYLRLSGRHDAGCPNAEPSSPASVSCHHVGTTHSVARKSGSESICNHLRRDERATRPVAICTAGARLITLSAASLIPSLSVPSFFAAPYLRPHTVSRRSISSSGSFTRLHFSKASGFSIWCCSLLFPSYARQQFPAFSWVLEE